MLDFNNASYLKLFYYVLAGFYIILSLILFIFALVYSNSSYKFAISNGGDAHIFKGNRLLYLASLAMVLPAVFYLFYGFDPKGYYTKEFDQKYQRYRWVEIALSGILMMAVCAIVLGVRSTQSLIGLVSLVLALGVLGIISENPTKIVSFKDIWSFIPQIASIIFYGAIVLILFLSYRYLRKKTTDEKPLPTWVKSFFWWSLLFFGGMTVLPFVRKYFVRSEGAFEYLYGIQSLIFRIVFSILIIYGMSLE